MTLQVPLLKNQNTWTKPLDKQLVLSGLAICLIGLVIVASASVEYSNKIYGSPITLVLKHFVYLVIGFIAFIVSSRIPLDFWFKTNWIWLLFGVFLLVVVLIPGIGREVNGSWRWIRLGPLSVQPSELIKFFLVLYVSGYLVRREAEVKSQWSGFLKPVFVMSLVILLLLMEPDFGAVVVITATILGLVFLGGVKAAQFFVLVLISFGAVYLMAQAEPYRLERLAAFLDPWSVDNRFAGGYQLTQALIAIGRGEWFGVGLGSSMLKLFYLPEAHTDFVFAILGEEFGFVGVMVVLTLYSLFLARVFHVGRLAELYGNRFGAFICYGIGLLFTIQTLINLGVNTGLLPTKGLTLPLMSYGGTSLIISLGMLGVVQAVIYHLDDQQGANP